MVKRAIHVESRHLPPRLTCTSPSTWGGNLLIKDKNDVASCKGSSNNVHSRLLIISFFFVLFLDNNQLK